MTNSRRTKFSNKRRAIIATAAVPIFAAAVLLTQSAHHAATRPAPATADLILHRGKIITVDANDSTSEAIAISGGKITAVGTSAEIDALTTPNTRVIDLHGRTATPGLIDTHGHFADGGANALFALSLSDATSIEEIVRRVRARASTLKPGEWLLGNGWDEGKLTDHRYVYASDLDKAAPSNPVWLTHTTGHYGVANTNALKLGHVSAAMKNPPAGTIDRDAQNAPTGVLKESAMELVTKLIPPISPEHERQAILHIIDELHAEGMTSVKDASISQHTWDAYNQILDDNKLTIRVFTLWYGGTTLDSARDTIKQLQALPRPPESLGNAKLFAGGAKLYMDGSGGARTAWVYDDWHKNSTEIDTGNKGYPAVDPEIYRQQVRLFHQAGITVGTHAVGDRANDNVVDTYAAVLQEKPTPHLRHTIIHANLPTQRALETIAMLQKKYDAAYPEVSAPFLWWIGDTYAGTFGPERSQRLVPLKSFMNRGIAWSGGSDFFVTPFAARYGLWSSVVRQPAKGIYGSGVFGTAESVDVHAALRSYTIWAAHNLFLDDKVGSLEPGKQADIAIWDRDPYSIPAADLKNLKCEATFFDGRLVYKSSDTPIQMQ